MILPGVPTTMSSPFLIAPADWVTTNKNQQSHSVTFKCLFVTTLIFPWLEAVWSVHSFQEQVVRVRALAGDIVLCAWARQFTLTGPLSTQEYKWVPAICWGNPVLAYKASHLVFLPLPFLAVHRNQKHLNKSLL